MKLRLSIVTCLILAAAIAFPLGAPAQNTPPPPVAVISLVWGVVTLKHQNEDYKPARWLDAIFPGDQVKTAGPGSKLLITYFFDNHQEVLSMDSEARVDPTGLTSLSGPAIRKDPARNPFSNGVQSPFVYSHRLIQADFKGADDPTAMDRENAYIQARVRSVDPITFAWLPQKGVPNYQLQIWDANNSLMMGFDSKTPKVKLKPAQSNKLFTGTVYTWGVTAPGNATVVPNYQFMYMSNPQNRWYTETVNNFQSLRKRGQLQRSDYTDYLLISAQFVRVDDVLNLAREIAAMDTKNPGAFRALTRAYLAKGCPAHARQAYDTEIQLGGEDPIYP
ncbi:MAG: hypothetical protein FJX76_06185 [Armatimonadetes bacterium]|nr:hypothetical protein [Armatimonadota bacterium]